MEDLRDNETTTETIDHYSDYQTSVDVNILNWIAALGIFPVTGVFGLIVNSLGIFVLKLQQKKTSTEILLIGLIIADCLSAVSMLVFVVPDTMSICSSVMPYEDLPEFFKADYSYAFVLYPINLSKILTAAIGFERAFAISKPFTFRTIWRPKVAVCIVVFCYVISGLVSIMPVVLPDVYTQYWLISVLYMAVIFLAVIICSIISVNGLWKNQKKLSGNKDSAVRRGRLAKEQRVTQVILGMMALFVVCNILPLVMQILDLMNPDDASTYIDDCTDVKKQIIVTGGFLLEVIYSVANTFIMILAKEGYKTKLLAILQCNQPQVSQSSN